jgi:hypothetical protein
VSARYFARALVSSVISEAVERAQKEGNLAAVLTDLDRN